MNRSPYLLVKSLEADILRLLSHVDSATLQTREQHRLAQLKNGLIDARLEIQDYELPETREHQLRNAKDAKVRLAMVEKLINENSLHIFGAVDIAHLTAQIGHISGKLK